MKNTMYCLPYPDFLDPTYVGVNELEICPIIFFIVFKGIVKPILKVW